MQYYTKFTFHDSPPENTGVINITRGAVRSTYLAGVHLAGSQTAAVCGCSQVDGTCIVLQHISLVLLLSTIHYVPNSIHC